MEEPAPIKEIEIPLNDVTTKKDGQANPEGKAPVADTKIAQSKVVRGNKKMRVDSGEFSGTTSEKKEPKEDDNAEAKIERSLKRSCELWSQEDKSTFFKALNEYGKDFDALQNYFMTQGKKKGIPEKMIKNKEQIRHFYYRTWLKISKNLKFSEDVKKTSQELYGLINYGELRRKLPRIFELKVQMKLNELVYYGYTNVRLRGKTMRIKTPICRALRKLNQLEDWQEEIKLPSRVTIELRPATNMAWWQVQAVAMNPRVKTNLPIQRRLSSILTFLQQRWRPVKYKTSTNPEVDAVESAKTSQLLRVAPPESCKVAMPVVNLGEYLTSSSVSLNSYEKRLCLKSSRVELLGSVQNVKGVGKKSLKKYKADKKMSKTDEAVAVPECGSDMDCSESAQGSAKKIDANHPEKSLAEPSTEPNRFPGRETVERIKNGWNVEEANTITVGDLFLMFGRDSKISLEYWWESPKDPSQLNKPKMMLQNDNLCLALQKLLSIAKHSYGSSKIYDNTSGSSETVVSSRVPSAKESTFRRPLIPQAYHQISTADAFQSQLDKFHTRYCKRKVIVRPKSLIHTKVLPQASATIDSPNVSTACLNEPSLNNDMIEPKEIGNSAETKVSESSSKRFFKETLQLSGQAKPSSIITSATQILKEGEQQWLNSEVADFSLSSFLGQLESPMKGSQRSQTGQSIADMPTSSDAISQMQCLMGESVDYMAKFANLASQMASDEQKK